MRAAAAEWNALAAAQRSPFLTVEWLTAWWESFGHGEPAVLTVRDDGTLRAAALLEREGELVFRTTRGGADLDRDLDAMLRVEAAGWKSSEGTAILSDDRTQRLYRAFAYAAAERGWLRIHLLELDGRALAADYSCV